MYRDIDPMNRARLSVTAQKFAKWVIEDDRARFLNDVSEKLEELYAVSGLDPMEFYFGGLERARDLQHIADDDLDNES